MSQRYYWMLIVLSLCVTSQAMALQVYEIIDLGDLPGGADYSSAAAINELGQVTGSSGINPSNNLSYSGNHAFFWDPVTGMTDLGDLPGGGDMSNGYDINNLGHVVGVSMANQTTHFRGFKWSGSGNIVDQGTVSGGSNYYSAYAINDAGHMIMSTWDYSGNASKSYLRIGSTWTNLGELPGGATRNWAQDLNASDEITGYSETSSGPRAYYWSSSTGIQDIGTLAGGDRSIANAINADGHIIGYSTYNGKSTDYYHAFYYDGTQMIDLGVLDPTADRAMAYGLNDLGLVVGNSKNADDLNRAVLWDPIEGIVDLNDYVLDMTGWDYIQTAIDINNAGQIVGNGYLEDGTRHAFLLNPVGDATPAIPAPLAVVGALMALLLPRRKSTV